MINVLSNLYHTDILTSPAGIVTSGKPCCMHRARQIRKHRQTDKQTSRHTRKHACTYMYSLNAQAHMSTHKHTHIYTLAQTHTHTQTHRHKRRHTNRQTNTHIHTHTHTHTHTHMRTRENPALAKKEKNRRPRANIACSANSHTALLIWFRRHSLTIRSAGLQSIQSSNNSAGQNRQWDGFKDRWRRVNIFLPATFYPLLSGCPDTIF